MTRRAHAGTAADRRRNQAPGTGRAQPEEGQDKVEGSEEQEEQKREAERVQRKEAEEAAKIEAGEAKPSVGGMKPGWDGKRSIATTHDNSR